MIYFAPHEGYQELVVLVIKQAWLACLSRVSAPGASSGASAASGFAAGLLAGVTGSAHSASYVLGRFAGV